MNILTNTTWFKIEQTKIAHKANPNPDTKSVTLVLTVTQVYVFADLRVACVQVRPHSNMWSLFRKKVLGISDNARQN